MVSANTLLLHVFRALAACGRSFSTGALAVFDDGVLDAILEAGGVTPSFEGEWGELVLRVPLDAQCPCVACALYAVPKHAVLFRQHRGYVQMRLRPMAAASILGLADMLMRTMGMPDHSVPGCSNRALQEMCYMHDAHDRETYGALFARQPDDLRAALAELGRYNNLARTGNEFFVPSALVRGACGGEII